MLFYMLIIRTLVTEIKWKSAQWCRTLKIILFVIIVHAWASFAISKSGDRNECR